METLGHREFAVVGHDRGSLTAFRMAMDYPDNSLITVDGIPVLEHLERADWKFARDWYHWFFFAQPEKPERAILADPKAWYSALSPDLMGAVAYDDLLDVIHNPDAVHGMIEDYRAGIRIDHEHDRADREAGKRVTCAMLCLWSTRDDLEKIDGDPVAIWRSWTKDVSGFGIDSGHHIAEENPGCGALPRSLPGGCRIRDPAIPDALTVQSIGTVARSLPPPFMISKNLEPGPPPCEGACRICAQRRASAIASPTSGRRIPSRSSSSSLPLRTFKWKR